MKQALIVQTTRIINAANGPDTLTRREILVLKNDDEITVTRLVVSKRQKKTIFRLFHSQ